MLNTIKSYINKYINKGKQFFINVALQLISSFLPIGVLQLFIYPNIAKTAGGDSYGLMLTIYSVWILISSSVSETICNTRLINAKEYEKEDLIGDYQIIAKRWLLISEIICIIVFLYYNSTVNFTNLFLQSLVALLMFLSNYYSYFFKIKLNYTQIFINKSLICLGYIVGYALFMITGYWELIFLCGYSFSVIHCLIVNGNDLFKTVKTKLYSKTIRDFRMLLAPNVIDSLTSYADKLILYPLIGGAEVSIYYVATIIGKITSMSAGAFRDVTLSYISKSSNDNKEFVKKVVIASFSIIVVFYFFTIFISKPVLGILYPQWIDEVNKYIYITTMASMLDVVVNIMSPFTLKYCDTKWQTVFSLSSALLYFSSSMILMHFFGLRGFCIGNVIGVLTKIILMLVVYFKKKD